MTHKELMNEADMLQGNINRMMVTDDKDELLNMYTTALRRLEKIYRERESMCYGKLKAKRIYQNEVTE